MLVMVDEPSGAIWGGVVAAPAFAQIAKFDLQYLEVPPDAPEQNTLDGLDAVAAAASAGRAIPRSASARPTPDRAAACPGARPPWGNGRPLLER